MSYRKTYKLNNGANSGGWYACTYCDKKVRFSSAHVDHIWPKSKGGSNDSWNLVVSCAPCNQSKGNKIDGRVVEGYATKLFR